MGRKEKSDAERFSEIFSVPYRVRFGDEDIPYALSMLKVLAKIGDLAQELSIVEDEITDMICADVGTTTPKKERATPKENKKLYEERQRRHTAFLEALGLAEKMRIPLTFTGFLSPLRKRAVTISKFLLEK